MRTLTLNELIEQLTALRDEGVDGDAEVRIALQPNYPFAHTVGQVVVAEESEDDEDEDEPMSPVVYIGEGRQIGYLDGQASRALGWKTR